MSRRAGPSSWAAVLLLLLPLALAGCGGLPEDKALDVIGHLADRTGVRATARRTGVTPKTVVRYARRLGEHARDLHDELVAFSPSDV